MLPRRAGYAVAVVNIVWPGAIIIAPLFVLGYCAFGAYRQYNPTFMMSPLDAHVFRHCSRLARDPECNLVPAFFTLGEPIEGVTRRMEAAGYRHGLLTGDDGNFVLDGREVKFTDYFDGPKGRMRLACGYELSVDMQFDDAGRLQAAMGDNSTACL